VRHAQIAQQLAFDWGSGLDRARALLALGRALLLEGELDGAAGAIAEARGLVEQNGNPYRVLDAQLAELAVERSRGGDVEAVLADLHTRATQLGIMRHTELGRPVKLAGSS